jgi:hypothetical protein
VRQAEGTGPVAAIDDGPNEKKGPFFLSCRRENPLVHSLSLSVRDDEKSLSTVFRVQYFFLVSSFSLGCTNPQQHNRSA